MDTIIITGAGGFIGSHLTEFLLKMGYSVKAFVRYNSRNSWGWLDSSPVKNDIQVITGDIRDYTSVRNALEGSNAVFHLAALIAIPYSYQNPLSYIRTNIEGTYNILQSAKELSLDNILITSTSETYGTAQYVPIDENHPMVGQSPYSATKIAADQLAISYYRSFGLPVKIVRPFNTFGPRQSLRAVIPTIISQFQSGADKLTLGNLDPTRDLVYVKDTVSGFYAIYNSGSLFGEITNIGTGVEISIRELARMISGKMGREFEIEKTEERVRPGNSEVERLLCNFDKLRNAAGWSTEYTLEKGLTETIDWFKNTENLELYKSNIYNV